MILDEEKILDEETSYHRKLPRKELFIHIVICTIMTIILFVICFMVSSSSKNLLIDTIVNSILCSGCFAFGYPLLIAAPVSVLQRKSRCSKTVDANVVEVRIVDKNIKIFAYEFIFNHWKYQVEIESNALNSLFLPGSQTKININPEKPTEIYNGNIEKYQTVVNMLFGIIPMCISMLILLFP